MQTSQPAIISTFSVPRRLNPQQALMLGWATQEDNNLIAPEPIFSNDVFDVYEHSSMGLMLSAPLLCFQTQRLAK